MIPAGTRSFRLLRQALPLTPHYPPYAVPVAEVDLLERNSRMALNRTDPLAAFNSLGLDRRSFLGLAGMGAAGMALAACSGPSTAPAAAGSSTAATVDFTGVTPASSISFWSNHPGSSEDVTTEIIKAFQATEEGKNIEVKLVTAGANYEEVAQKFQTAQAAGPAQLPDLVVFSDVWWFRYFLAGSITPLDSLIKAVGLDTTKYRQGLIEDYQYGGSQWAIPWARSTPLFYYNKNQWGKAGLEDRAPKTWAEFAEWAPKLAAANSGVTPYQHAALADYAGWTFQNILWGNGGGWSTDWDLTAMDSDASVQAIQFLQDSVYTGKWAGVSSKSATDDLIAGAVSSAIGSTGSLVGVLKGAADKFEVGVGFLPGGPTSASPVCPTGGAGVGIPGAIEPARQLAAATFLKFLTNAENTVKLSAATGYLPVREDADTAALISNSPLSQVAIDQLAVVRKQDNARVFIPGADTEIAAAMGEVLTAQAPVKESLTGLKSKLQGMYDSQVKPKLGS